MWGGDKWENQQQHQQAGHRHQRHRARALPEVETFSHALASLALIIVAEIGHYSCLTVLISVTIYVLYSIHGNNTFGQSGPPNVSNVIVKCIWLQLRNVFVYSVFFSNCKMAKCICPKLLKLQNLFVSICQIVRHWISFCYSIFYISDCVIGIFSFVNNQFN